jgi:hypothetical protein
MIENKFAQAAILGGGDSAESVIKKEANKTLKRILKKH